MLKRNQNLLKTIQVLYEKMIKEKGNSDNYDTQLYKQPDIDKINDESLITLIKTIHKHKKGLEQEYLINDNFAHIK